MKFSFTTGSNIDVNLTAEWREWQKEQIDTPVFSWFNFLKTMYGVAAVTYDVCPPRTIVTFDDELALSMFILRWS